MIDELLAEGCRVCSGDEILASEQTEVMMIEFSRDLASVAARAPALAPALGTLARLTRRESALTAPA